MGVLRSDLITHSSLEPTGSVLLDGNSDYLSWSDTSIKLGTSDFTLEAWINITSDTTAHQTIFMAGDSSDAGEMVFQMITADSGSAIGSGAGRELGVRVAGTGYYSGFRIVFGEWTHVACVRNGGTLTFFVDGVQGMSHAVAENLTTAFTQIGYRDGSYNGYFNGYISNARIALGALYKNSFTPSKFELENVPGTLLLCCQSSTSATTAAVIPSAITAQGTAAASAVAPDIRKDITDIGPVFVDGAVFDTLSYMVPPGGTTAQSNRGRGLLMGGAVSPGATNTTQIKYFDIASQGITDDFGQTSVARRATGSLSSSTRAVMGGGFVAPPSPYTLSDVMDYVTIATTANAIDFGNMQSTAYHYATASNETRGLFAGGYRPNNSAVVNTIDLITIATTGNASNFGDLTRTARSFGGAGSTTRGVFFGGTHPAIQDVIDYVTFSTTGDATDFGNLTDARDNVYGASSSTRAVMAGGRDPNTTNNIDYITIASTGDATDFGDLTQTSYYFNASTSNSIRAVWVGTSTIVNSMEYVTIATTGNSVDWGDQGGTIQHSGGACSDSHGGIA